ncbi:AprI/Inh family metalloprotease inhibitor [Brevundimonas sp. BAL450]|jgi:hypothetical protein|uniref:AprI/Inh family metalloprotease inhibitor n=1 Tax=Brevundimonas sp. BAL450 TaxID=1708162 RepID=UPI0018C9CC39|nr:AprI/Inh family metalloprotease inhibitor [Brevundimonas sp. BAL450]MBG7615345.1 AprI/Inh family metalloprotease inhibitor [Brevundimonas sp. BAL450]
MDTHPTLPGLVAALFMAGSGWAQPSETSAMTIGIPALQPAEHFAGNWRMSGGGVSCTLTLRADPTPVPRPAAPSFALDVEGTCPGGLEQHAFGAWRPASDGIDLTDQQGRTRLFLSRTAPGVYEATLPSGEAIHLTRG